MFDLESRDTTDRVKKILLPSYDVSGGYGLWGEWGECSLACGDGWRQRQRLCDNPRQEGAGAECPGVDTATNSQGQIEACNLATCTEGKKD